MIHDDEQGSSILPVSSRSQAINKQQNTAQWLGTTLLFASVIRNENYRFCYN